MVLTFEELLAYVDEERAKWDAWFRGHPREAATAAWPLLDHLFVTELRHTQRIRVEYPLPESTGVAPGDWDALWQWSVVTRRKMLGVYRGLDEARAAGAILVPLMGEMCSVTPRKLLFHVLIHETRHWAQVASVLRAAGFEPPGRHDFVFSSAIQ